MYFTRLVVLSALGLFAVTLGASAQTKPGSANVATALCATEVPTLDGDVLGDPAWKNAPQHLAIAC